MPYAAAVSRPARLLALSALFVLLVLLVITAAPGPQPARAATAYAAPLPRTIQATYFDKGDGEYVFRSRREDLAKMRKAFNVAVVSASPWRWGDTSQVRAVRNAGMKAIVELDYKDEFVSGQRAYVRDKVNEVIAATKAHPGMISGIHVADQLNKGSLTPAQQVDYLAATAGRFHKALPGVPVFVDAASWELTCDEPGQASCAGQADSRWSYQTNRVLKRLVATGYLDGLFLSDNLLKNDADVQRLAMRRARAMFPKPFRIVARTSHLSFPEKHFPGTPRLARRLVKAYVLASRDGGADGAGLWSWHRPWENESGRLELRTILDKDFSGNALWTRLREVRP